MCACHMQDMCTCLTRRPRKYRTKIGERLQREKGCCCYCCGCGRGREQTRHQVHACNRESRFSFNERVWSREKSQLRWHTTHGMIAAVLRRGTHNSSSSKQASKQARSGKQDHASKQARQHTAAAAASEQHHHQQPRTQPAAAMQPTNPTTNRQQKLQNMLTDSSELTHTRVICFCPLSIHPVSTQTP
jgi:hypothetical protein